MYDLKNLLKHYKLLNDVRLKFNYFSRKDFNIFSVEVIHLQRLFTIFSVVNHLIC